MLYAPSKSFSEIQELIDKHFRAIHDFKQVTQIVQHLF